MKRLCVFCGSSAGSDPRFRHAAVQLGQILGRERIDLVYGGGKVGLMGVLAQAVLEAGGRVTGVIPQSLEEKELAFEGCTELRVVETMHERKALMSGLADAFIAMPGGFGTFEELFETLTWLQLGIHAKPTGLLNTAGYYDGLLAFLDHAVDSSFLLPEHKAMIPVSDDPRELVARLAAFVAPDVDKVRWVRGDAT